MKQLIKKLQEKYNKANKKKLFLSIAFFLSVLVILWAFLTALIITKNFNRNQIMGTENKKALDVSSVILVETKNDEKFWEIYAQSGTYTSNNKIAMLENVTGNFYKNNEVSMSFKSTKGTYNEKTNEIIMYDKTYIVIKDGTSMFCDTLIYRGSDKDIEVKGNIKIIKDKDLISTADEGYIASDYSKFKIKGNSKTKLFGKKKSKETKIKL